MIWCLFLLFVVSPVLTGVLKEDTIKCGETELACDGQCVPLSKFCDGFKDCSDGKDEEVCTPEQRPAGQGKCVLPQHPENGRYVINNLPFAAPGQVYDSVYLNVTCNPGYGVDSDSNEVFCLQGLWSKTMPQCVRFCKLPKHPSVEYRCQSTGSNVQGSTECGELVPIGTRVRPECRAPNYYYQDVLNTMRCIDGVWDYIAICKPGLDRNGTNITIIIKDQIEIHISNFVYVTPDDTPVRPVTADNLVDYEINEGDWRIAEPTKPVENKNKVTVNIQNSSVVVNSDKIHFPKY